MLWFKFIFAEGGKGFTRDTWKGQKLVRDAWKYGKN